MGLFDVRKGLEEAKEKKELRKSTLERNHHVETNKESKEPLLQLVEPGARVKHGLTEVDRRKAKTREAIDFQGDIRITVFQRHHGNIDDISVADRENTRHKTIHNYEGKSN